jgi:uncharacterized heparinase superfamily protein
MVRIGLSDRARFAAVRARRAQRATASWALGSRLLRPRWMTAPGLGVVPQDMRSADPSFWAELATGHFGLPSATAALDGYSPFDVVPPTLRWQSDLHAFGWLRHLAVSDDPEAMEAARELVLEWMAHHRNAGGVAAAPDVRARRVLSWLSHAPFVLEQADARQVKAFSTGLSLEVARLAATWRNANEGYPKLLALTARVAAYLALEGKASALDRAIVDFSGEIERQVLDDGGHVSRNLAVLVDLLLDWLPLRTCFDVADVDPPAALCAAILQIQVMIRALRLGDGCLARFNGMGVGDVAGLATLLAYDDPPANDCELLPVITNSKYVRLQRGPMTVLVDAGGPPPLLVSGAAHAGCLSFEMSFGRSLVIVNCGAPGAADQHWQASARATACHSAACVGELSSAQLLRDEHIERVMAGSPVQGPTRVSASVARDADGLAFSGSHDGYEQRVGLEYRRTLHVSEDGTALSGTDWMGTPGGRDRLKRDVPFAIHFHVHPDATCDWVRGRGDAERAACEIRFGSGEILVFEATGADVRLEESLFFAGSSGPRSAVQIVVRGACAGDSTVVWSIRQRRGAGQGPDVSTQKSVQDQDVGAS